MDYLEIRMKEEGKERKAMNEHERSREYQRWELKEGRRSNRLRKHRNLMKSKSES